MRRDLRAVLWLSAASTAAVVGAYWLALGDGGLSRVGADWGQFGDYVGGAVGPLLNLVVLYVMLRTLDDTRRFTESQRLEGLLLRSVQSLEGLIARSDTDAAAQEVVGLLRSEGQIPEVARLSCAPMVLALARRIGGLLADILRASPDLVAAQRYCVSAATVLGPSEQVLLGIYLATAPLDGTPHLGGTEARLIVRSGVFGDALAVPWNDEGQVHGMLRGVAARWTPER